MKPAFALLLLLVTLRPADGAGAAASTKPLTATVSIPAASQAPAPPKAVVKSGDAVSLLPGELFKFQVGWGLFSGAGEIKVTATSSSLAGQLLTRVTTQTATKGVIGALYSFTGEAVADFDSRDGRLLTAHADTRAGKKPTQMAVTFDYARSEAAYVDPLRPARTRMLSLPPGRPMDLITVLIQARAWNLKPGEKHAALVLFDDEFYPLTITAQKVENISTPKGRRDAMMLIPEMAGPPKGMFKKGGAVKVWISNDRDRLPLKFEVKVKVGTATATLVDYQPPASVPAKPADKSVTLK
ncbi:MAG: DUF3108 domain-containing protein [Verrucomicrobiota bacterium]